MFARDRVRDGLPNAARGDERISLFMALQRSPEEFSCVEYGRASTRRLNFQKSGENVADKRWKVGFGKFGQNF